MQKISGWWFLSQGKTICRRERIELTLYVAIFQWLKDLSVNFGGYYHDLPRRSRFFAPPAEIVYGS